MVPQISNARSGHDLGGLGACHCCGLIHVVPMVGPGRVACCVRCQSVIRHGAHPRSTMRAGALALGALVLYPLALGLPVMEIERLGNVNTVSVWSGMVGLLAEGHLFVGVAVLLFSIVAPIGKLGSLFLLCLGQQRLAKADRARVYRFVEFIGRWGMVDVMLVAVLVAVVKLGDLVTVTPGPGVSVFGAVVLLSLIATSVFDPHAIWETQEGAGMSMAQCKAQETKDQAKGQAKDQAKGQTKDRAQVPGMDERIAGSCDGQEIKRGMKQGGDHESGM